MITVQQVFDTAIYMMDEQYETNGITETTDTKEYKFRTLAVINSLLPQLYPYSDNYDTSGTGRPVCPQLKLPTETTPQLDFTQEIPLDETLALGVLPYGLAAHLLASEDMELSAWFLNRYNQAFADLRSKIPGSFEPIVAPYGLF